ncbi:MAG: hypothetical protein JNL50_02300, partial [Phycisphaerae bacterium]|nr:hypothetical protein [Phycisphaerae bacterium]
MNSRAALITLALITLGAFAAILLWSLRPGSPVKDAPAGNPPGHTPTSTTPSETRKASPRLAVLSPALAVML